MALLLLAGCDAAQDAASTAGTAGSAVEASADELNQPNIESVLTDDAGPGAETASSAGAPTLQPRTDPPPTTAAGATASAATPGTEAPATTETTAAPSTETSAAPAPTTEAPTTEPPAPSTTPPPVPTTAAAPSPSAPAPISSDPLPAAAAEFLTLLNQVRAGQGLGPLGSDGRLTASATAQVDDMISTAGLFHQSLADELSQGWSIVGENVGYGPNVPVIHQALVNSPGHYQNLVNTRYTHVGIAVVTDGSGRMWVAQVFGG